MRGQVKGRLIAVVGPSGAGKDTLLKEIKKCLTAYFPTRYITRPPHPNDENYHSVTKNEFKSLIHNKMLAFHWSAHGLQYGIPIDINVALLTNQIVLFNCSRSQLQLIIKDYPNLEIINIVANKDILRQRLLERGRETPKEIDKRILREHVSLPGNPKTVDNSTTVAHGIKNFLEAINS